MADEVLTVFKADIKDYESKLRVQQKVLGESEAAERSLLDQTQKRLVLMNEEVQDLQELKKRRDEAFRSKEVSEFNKRINETTDRIEDLGEEIGVAADELDDFADEAVEAAEKTKELGKVGEKAFGLLDKLTFGLAGKMRGLFASVVTVTKGMKGLRLAIISTGIGALVLLITALVTYFTQTQRGADFVSKALKGMGAIVSVLVDRLSSLGETIIEAFQNPKKALKDFAKAIKTFVQNRIDDVISGFKGLGTVVQKLFARDFKGALEAGKKAAIDLATGLTVVGGVIKDNKDAIKELGEEIAKEAEAAFKLEEANHKLRDSLIALSVERAKSRAEIKRLNLIAEDISKSEEERIKAAEKALQIEQGLMQKRIELAEERVRIVREENALSESMVEDVQRLADAEIELANVKEESLELQTTINNKINSIRQQALAAELARIKALADAEKAAHDLAVSLVNDAAENEQLVLERLFLEKKISQEEFSKQSLMIEQIRISQMQELYDEDSLEWKRLQNEKLRITDEYYQAQIEAAKQAADKEAEEWTELDAIILDLERQNAEDRVELEKETQERLRREREAGVDAALELGGQLADIAVQQSENKIARIEEESAKSKEASDDEIQDLYRQLEVARGADRKKIQSSIDTAKAKQELDEKQTEENLKQERERLKNMKRAQLVAATISEAVAIARAFAELGPIAGAIAAVGLAVKFAVLLAAIESQEFAEGSEYVSPANSTQGRRVDDIPAMLTKGEAVIPVKENLQNRGLVRSLIKGDVDEYIKRNYVLPEIQKQMMTDITTNDMRVIQADFNDRNIVNSLKRQTRQNAEGVKMMVKALSSTKRHARDAA